MLELPITIRIPKPWEMPHRTDIDELLYKRKNALIVQGFEWKDNRTPQLPYSFSATINVDNSKLWALFLALSEEFPQEANVVYGYSEEEAVTSKSLSKEKILLELSKFQTELSKDGRLAFGLINHTKSSLVELTITESKYVKFWGVNKESFLECMKKFNIPQQRGLEFIDEYPKIVEPLKKFLPASKKPEEVIKYLDGVFHFHK
jgi:hypothetical protein